MDNLLKPPKSRYSGSRYSSRTHTKSHLGKQASGKDLNKDIVNNQPIIQ